MLAWRRWDDFPFFSGAHPEVFFQQSGNGMVKEPEAAFQKQRQTMQKL
jgi:hypothetical protein